MVRLYLDVETYRPNNEDVFVNEKIIAIVCLRTSPLIAIIV